MTTKLEKDWHDALQAWSTHEPEKIVSEMPDGFVYEDMPMKITVRGREEMKAFVQDCFSAFPDFKLEHKSFFASGNRGFGEWVMSGTFLGELQSFGLKPTGKSFAIPGVSVFEVQGDKVTKETLYYDGAAFLQVLGLIPEVPWAPH